MTPLAGFVESTFPRSGRVTLPARFREAFKSGMVVAVPALDRPILMLYPFRAWHDMAGVYHALQDKLPLEIRRGIIRQMTGRAELLPLSARGRFSVPRELRIFSGRAMMFGEGQYVAFARFKEDMARYERSKEARPCAPQPG
jgi:DNA-binding transcriptional regulator/RsmH inhibitor MraZ